VPHKPRRRSPKRKIRAYAEEGPREPAICSHLIRYQGDYFAVGKEAFEEVEEVAEGMGPRMNLDRCVGCHSQPATGGSAPAVNPQIAFAGGGSDDVPPFPSLNGPVREARFVKNKDGTPDGGVHALFTISGREGAEGCSRQRRDWAAQVAAKNVFRIPTPTFGAGLIEMIPDWAILANRASAASTKSALGIRGRPHYAVAGRTISGQNNNNGNDGLQRRDGHHHVVNQEIGEQVHRLVGKRGNLRAAGRKRGGVAIHGSHRLE
jgi:hypothetical protein